MVGHSNIAVPHCRMQSLQSWCKFYEQWVLVDPGQNGDFEEDQSCWGGQWGRQGCSCEDTCKQAAGGSCWTGFSWWTPHIDKIPALMYRYTITTDGSIEQLEWFIHIIKQPTTPLLVHKTQTLPYTIVDNTSTWIRHNKITIHVKPSHTLLRIWNVNSTEHVQNIPHLQM